jgi:hypothetical protein
MDLLLNFHPWAMQAWHDRYGKGVWVAIAPTCYSLDSVRDSTSAGDLDMETATNFLLDSKILPIVVGQSFSEAMNKLESRLADLPADQLISSSAWARAVLLEYEYFNEQLNRNHEYGDLSLRDPAASY